MRWFIPTHNGDLRLEADGDGCALEIHAPTESEKLALGQVLALLEQKKWTKNLSLADVADHPYRDGPKRVPIYAPIEEVGPAVLAILRPGPAVLTAVRLVGGKVEVCEHRAAGKGSGELEALAKKPAEAATTVRRPTPSCPDCFVRANTPATEALLAFLSPEQHKTWAEGRFVVVRGGLTGHRYVISHRHHPRAARATRICFDTHDRDVLHFHDWRVPPEEEVLAAMLILRHREPWLRNQATCLGMRFSRVFENPFGDINDGIWDSNVTRMIGMAGRAMTPSAPS